MAMKPELVERNGSWYAVFPGDTDTTVYFINERTNSSTFAFRPARGVDPVVVAEAALEAMFGRTVTVRGIEYSVYSSGNHVSIELNGQYFTEADWEGDIDDESAKDLIRESLEDDEFGEALDEAEGLYDHVLVLDRQVWGLDMPWGVGPMLATCEALDFEVELPTPTTVTLDSLRDGLAATLESNGEYLEAQTVAVTPTSTPEPDEAAATAAVEARTVVCKVCGGSGFLPMDSSPCPECEGHQLVTSSAAVRLHQDLATSKSSFGIVRIVTVDGRYWACSQVGYTYFASSPAYPGIEFELEFADGGSPSDELLVSYIEDEIGDLA